MVKLVPLILLLIINSFVYGSSLQVIADKPTVELGKPINITINAKDIKQNLASISIKRLEEDFGVYVIESANRFENNINIQELKIALYPHRIGKHEIPSIKLGSFKSEIVPVTIIAAREKNQTLEFSSSVSASSIWQRQQIIISTHIITHSKFATIKLEDFIQEGFDSYKLKTSRQDLGNGMYRLSSGWAIYPLIAGKQNINLPAVNYRLRGNVQRKFIPDNARLNIQQLPSYIPPLMPVGKISINSLITTDSNNSDKSHTISVNISSETVLPTTLPNLPQNYILDGDISIGETTSNTLNEAENNTLRTRIQHSVPVAFNRSGIYRLQELSVKYFDVTSGRIVTATGNPVSTVILLPWLRYSLLIIILVLSSKIIITVNKHINIFLRLTKERKNIINATLAAKSPCELHHLLNKYARTYNWGDNMTLGNWLIVWEKNRPSAASAGKSLIDRLSEACYSEEKMPSLNQDVFLLLSSK